METKVATLRRLNRGDFPSKLQIAFDEPICPCPVRARACSKIAIPLSTGPNSVAGATSVIGREDPDSGKTSQATRKI